MSILKQIHDYKLKFVESQKKIISQKEIINKYKLIDSEKSYMFSEKLINENNKKISIIGELKRSSPSAGNIVNENIDLLSIAKKYEENGISCISVLTDEKYFNGSVLDLIKIKKNCSVPLLRKDFIVDEYQLHESKLMGANCILLILSMLDDKKACLFEEISMNLGLDVLIEVHNEDEMMRAKKMKSVLIGINNRNLNDFSVDIENSIRISKLAPMDKIIISESGINTRNDIDHIRENSNIDTFLIGESLMKSPNLDNYLRNLIN